MNQTWHDRKNACQTLDFSSLTFGKMHPSDIDAVYEYHDRGAVYMEAKCRNAQLGLGQRLLLERLADRGLRTGMLDRVLVIDHYVYDAAQDIDLGQCTIRDIYDGAWHNVKAEEITVRDYIVEWMQKCDREDNGE